MRVFHVLHLLTSRFCGLGGAIWVVIRVMFRLLHIFLIVFICSVVPILLFW